jgi:urea transport system permease protein
LLLVHSLTGLAQESPDFEPGVVKLNVRSFSEKAQALDALVAVDDVRVMPVLKGLLEGELYVDTGDASAEPRVVILREADGIYTASDVVSGASHTSSESDAYKKIGVNNRLRTQLRELIAKLSLNDSSAEVRLAAVENLMHDIDAANEGLLRQRLTRESDSRVREVIELALALIDVESTEVGVKVDAIHALGNSLNPQARTKLKNVLAREGNNFLERDANVRAAAREALASIDLRLETAHVAETLFFGLSLGSVLLLSSIGLAITFGVMGVINMAHGEMMMLGAYTTYLIQLALPDYIDYSLLLAVPAAFIVSGLFGVAIERGVIRHLYGRPLETLLATVGISLILQQLVRTAISAQNVAVSNPSWMSGSWQLNAALSLTYNRLYILLFALVVFVLLLLLLKKSALGLHVRAVAQNRMMARAMGIRSDWVDAMTFGLGSGIAGVAGVALSQLTNVGPNMGQSYIIDSFMVVVFGGVGNLWGTLVGAMSLGVANKVLEPWAGAVLAKILVLVFIILFIQRRPRGLFPQKGRAAEH